MKDATKWPLSQPWWFIIMRLLQLAIIVSAADNMTRRYGLPQVDQFLMIAVLGLPFALEEFLRSRGLCK